MKATELRIGNFIRTYGEDVGYREVKQLLVGGVITNGKFPKDQLTYDLAEGIPLTKEWLVKFGFDMNEYKLGEYPFWEVGDFELLYDEEKEEFFYVHSYEGDKDTPINHVHQLQNLYFALCGVELEIKN